MVPEYERCIDIATVGALRELIPAGLMAIVVTLAVGFIGGIQAVGGFLTGNIVAGLLLALYMSNAGGLWDNAKNMWKLVTAAEKVQRRTRRLWLGIQLVIRTKIQLVLRLIRRSLSAPWWRHCVLVCLSLSQFSRTDDICLFKPPMFVWEV